MVNVKWMDKNFELVIMAIFLAVMTAVTFSNVFLRYIFASAIIWADEIGKYCFVLSGFFSVPCWVRRRSGIRVDAFVSMLPVKQKERSEILVYFILAAFFSYLFVNTISVAQNLAQAGQVSPVLRFPVQIIYYLVAASFVLAVFRCIQVLIEMLHRNRLAPDVEGSDGTGVN